jgi:hypothetical protein
MAHVSNASPIITFRRERSPENYPRATLDPEHLRAREAAERAAAKASTSLAARRAHQELAQLISEARQKAERGLSA